MAKAGPQHARKMEEFEEFEEFEEYSVDGERNRRFGSSRDLLQRKSVQTWMMVVMNDNG